MRRNLYLPDNSIFMQQSDNPNALCHRIPISLSSKMKAEIEKESDILGISEQGFMRMCVRLYFKGGGLKASELPTKEDL